MIKNYLNINSTKMIFSPSTSRSVKINRNFEISLPYLNKIILSNIRIRSIDIGYSNFLAKKTSDCKIKK